MSAEVNFNCFIKAQDTDWENFQFRMSDIYVSELNKWLKADSVDDAKMFFNLEILKSVKSFGFYTKSVSNERWSAGKEQILNDFFKYKKSGKFRLKIIAISSSFAAIVTCRDCQPTASLIAPTPVGQVQSYTLRYESAVIEKMAAMPALK